MLRAKVERYAHMNFAQKRERFIDPNQATLPFELPEEEKQQLEAQTTEKISYERKKAKRDNHPGRQPLPEHLPVEEIHIQPEEDTTDMVCIGTEVTDELEYKPASYFIRRYIRYKYARKDKEGVLIGSLPGRIIEKGIAGAGLLASILVDKYMDHLPLYRQWQQFKRRGVALDRSVDLLPARRGQRHEHHRHPPNRTVLHRRTSHDHLPARPLPGTRLERRVSSSQRRSWIGTIATGVSSSSGRWSTCGSPAVLSDPCRCRRG